MELALDTSSKNNSIAISQEGEILNEMCGGPVIMKQ